MNTTLSKGAFGFDATSSLLKELLPGRNGLYGKKPLANVIIAIGINIFDATRVMESLAIAAG
jgi:hypothetical protein